MENDTPLQTAKKLDALLEDYEKNLSIAIDARSKRYKDISSFCSDIPHAFRYLIFESPLIKWTYNLSKKLINQRLDVENKKYQKCISDNDIFKKALQISEPLSTLGPEVASKIEKIKDKCSEINEIYKSVIGRTIKD
jgi:hypothetical protein